VLSCNNEVVLIEVCDEWLGIPIQAVPDDYLL